jgi:hypothetical protein
MKNAYTGYTYQKQITSLFLAKMDVERSIDSIEMEVNANNHFDDLIVTSTNEKFCIQIKDIDNISLNSLRFKENSVIIKDKKHLLSQFTNIIFFKQIEISPNCEIFGIPAYISNNVYIVSLNRENVDERISNLYNLNQERDLTSQLICSRVII